MSLKKMKFCWTAESQKASHDVKKLVSEEFLLTFSHISIFVVSLKIMKENGGIIKNDSLVMKNKNDDGRSKGKKKIISV